MENSATSYKLYGIPYLGSMAIELLMEEAGIKYDIVFPTPEERNSEEFKKILISKIPTGDLGSGEDVANCVAFLASDMAKYINGETIHVNGGMYMA